MISQTVRSECVRFGGHVGIQVSYKILQLEVLKESSILDTSPLNMGCFEVVLSKNTQGSSGIKNPIKEGKKLNLIQILKIHPNIEVFTI
jgi:hypothetical protein